MSSCPGRAGPVAPLAPCPRLGRGAGPMREGGGFREPARRGAGARRRGRPGNGPGLLHLRPGAGGQGPGAPGHGRGQRPPPRRRPLRAAGGCRDRRGRPRLSPRGSRGGAVGRVWGGAGSPARSPLCPRRTKSGGPAAPAALPSGAAGAAEEGRGGAAAAAPQGRAGTVLWQRRNRSSARRSCRLGAPCPGSTGPGAAVPGAGCGCAQSRATSVALLEGSKTCGERGKLS